MADYDSDKQTHQLNVVDGTIDENSLILAQDVVGNPLGIAKPAAIVGATTIDDIQDGSTSKKISAAEKTSYDSHLVDTSDPHSTTKAQVGLSDADNTSDVNKPVSTAQQVAIDAHANLTNDPHDVTQTQVGLSEVDNVSGANAVVSIAQQAAIDAHADLTNDPHDVTQTQVGLSEVDNTSDDDKPVSTAQQTALDAKVGQNGILVGGGAVLTPRGTTAQRPVAPDIGWFWYNTTLASFEGWNGSAWGSVGGGATGGEGNQVFVENDTNVTVDYTITTNKNAMSAGPIEVDNGVTVTVPDGSTWTIV